MFLFYWTVLMCCMIRSLPRLFYFDGEPGLICSVYLYATSIINTVQVAEPSGEQLRKHATAHSATVESQALSIVAVISSCGRVTARTRHSLAGGIKQSGSMGILWSKPLLLTSVNSLSQEVDQCFTDTGYSCAVG